MADRSNLLAAIRAKRMASGVGAPTAVPSKQEDNQKSLPPFPSKTDTPPSSNAQDRPQAPAALALKEAMAKMGGNVRANLKPSSGGINTSMPPPGGSGIRPSPSATPSTASKFSSPAKSPVGFYGTDLREQIRLRAEKKAAAENASSPPPPENSKPPPPKNTTSPPFKDTAPPVNKNSTTPKIDLNMIGATKKPAMSYRSGVITQVDPPAKVKIEDSPRPIFPITKSIEPVKPLPSASNESVAKRSVQKESSPNELNPEDLRKKTRSLSREMSRNSLREIQKNSDNESTSVRSSTIESPNILGLPSSAGTNHGKRLLPSAYPRSTSPSSKSVSSHRSRKRTSEKPKYSTPPSPLVATPKPVDRYFDESPLPVSPPYPDGPQFDSSTNIRIVTEQAEVRRVWRKLTCRVLPDTEVEHLE